MRSYGRLVIVDAADSAGEESPQRVSLVGVFSSWYLFVPAVAALLSIGFRHAAARHLQDRRDQRGKAGVPPTPVAPDAGDEAPPPSLPAA